MLKLITGNLFISALILFLTGCSARNRNVFVPGKNSGNLNNAFYGYAFSLEECEEFMPEPIRGYQIQPGDIIADVGAASGYVEGAMAVLTDSVTYYVQDINTTFLNKEILAKVVQHYDSIRGRPQTNTFHYVIGTDKETSLPAGFFDKIILNNTFHELRHPEEICRDIVKKLKPGGKVIVAEVYNNKNSHFRHRGCGIKAYTVSKVQKIFSQAGLYLTNMSAPEYSYYNFLTFETDKIKSDIYLKKVTAINYSLAPLLQLNKYATAINSNKTDLILQKIKNNKTTISTVFPTLFESLHSLAGYYQSIKAYRAAINISEMNRVLYPDSIYSYINLGDVYLAKNQVDSAAKYYSAALGLQPQHKIALLRMDKAKGITKK